MDYNNVPENPNDEKSLPDKQDSSGIESAQTDFKNELLNTLSRTHITIPEETSYGLLMMTRSLEVPLEREHVYYPLDLYQKILDEASKIPHVKAISEHLRKELLSDPFTENYEGAGYVIINGLYNNSVYSNKINPNNLSAEQLAPIDESKSRAYEFNTELCEEQLKVAMIVTCLCGIPYRMFDAKKFVIPVTSYESLDPTKFGGAGVNLLHKDGGFLAPIRNDDLDSVRLGPATDISSLLCINPDNTGKGKSWILKENVPSLRMEFTEEELSILESNIFSYMPAHGLNDAIGLDRFPIFYTDFRGKQRIRFSGKLIQHLQKNTEILENQNLKISATEIMHTLEKLNDALMKWMIVIPVEAGQLFISNQHTTFHGREEVGDQNRLLAQLFSRVPHDFGSTRANKYRTLFI